MFENLGNMFSSFDASKYLGKDSALGNLANSYLSGLGGSKSQPKPVVIQQAAPAPIYMPAPMPAAAPSSSFGGLDPKMLMIGGGALALVLVLAITMRK